MMVVVLMNCGRLYFTAYKKASMASHKNARPGEYCPEMSTSNRIRGGSTKLDVSCEARGRLRANPDDGDARQP